MIKKLILDMHSHFLTQQYIQAMKVAGTNDVDGYPLPNRSLEEHLKLMVDNDIAKCIISVSSPGLSFVKAFKTS